MPHATHYSTSPALRPRLAEREPLCYGSDAIVAQLFYARNGRDEEAIIVTQISKGGMLWDQESGSAI